jgi:hypothetical protein
MRKGRPKAALILTAEERQRLESFAHRSRSAAALARRARIMLACAEGTVGQLIVELDVGVLQPERAHEVRHRFNRRRSRLTVERILAGVAVADHVNHEGPFTGGAVVGGPRSSARGSSRRKVQGAGTIRFKL